MPDVCLEERRTGMFEEQSFDRREKVAVDRIGIIVKAHREWCLACEQASVTPTTRPTSCRRRQYCDIGKPLVKFRFQFSVAQVDMDDDGRRCRIAQADLLQYGQDFHTPVVRRYDCGYWRLCFHDLDN
jgi:hypothetical protein